MTEFVKTHIEPYLDAESCNRLIIRAPVKSGKREIAEYLAMRDQASPITRVHMFLSAWHRAADEEQRKELARHNLAVFSAITKAVVTKCIAWITQQLAEGKTVVIHLDECDHGSGEKQILGKIYRFVRENPRVFIILYSATPQEVLFSGDATADTADEGQEELLDDLVNGTHIEYTPPEGYCGPARFLDAGLIYDAQPFFTMKPIPALTAQGREILVAWLAEIATGRGRNIVALRLCYSDGGKKKEDRAIQQFLRVWKLIPELLAAGVDVIFDKGDMKHPDAQEIKWSHKPSWDRLTKDKPILIVMEMTSSRSTEWACHDRMFALHEFRNTIQYAADSQAQERVNHYESKYGRFQEIRVYGHKKTFELSAGRINYATYLNCEWVMKKVDTRRAARDNLGTEDLYEIKSSAAGHALHPAYPAPLLEPAAKSALVALGCIGDAKLSARVKGSVRPTPIFAAEFFPCDVTTFDTALTPVKAAIAGGRYVGSAFQNPFQQRERPPPNAAGKEHGYLRKWDVFDYDTQIATQPGWGVGANRPRLTICYKNGVLGVAIRWNTGETRMQDRLSAFRSMYPSRF